jgi:hypothetical protein
LGHSSLRWLYADPSYWLEPRSKWFVLVFAGASAATAAYNGLVEAYPITVIEALWLLMALQRFDGRHQWEADASP